MNITTETTYRLALHGIGQTEFKKIPGSENFETFPVSDFGLSGNSVIPRQALADDEDLRLKAEYLKKVLSGYDMFTLVYVPTQGIGLCIFGRSVSFTGPDPFKELGEYLTFK